MCWWFSFRLEYAHVVLGIATELDEWLCNIESALVNQHGITTDPVDVDEQYQNLVTLQREFLISDESIKKLKVASAGLRDVELTETTRIVDRWEQARVQLQARTPKMQVTVETVGKLRKCVEGEMGWLKITYARLTAVKILPDDADDLQKLQDEYSVSII